MARTLEEITNDIVAAKEAQASLDGLTSDSATAIWKLWVNIMAYFIWFHETLWDLYKQEVTAIANSQKAGTASWYQQQALLFQYGDPLVFINNVPTYAVINDELKIVKECSVTETSDGIVFIKVAKEPTPGSPEPLTTPELDAFKAYVDDIKFAGTLTAVISQEADEIAISGEVFYNALYDVPALQAALEAALDDYRKNLPFNGIVKVNSIIDVVQGVEGINDFVISGATGTPDGGSVLAFDRTYTTVAGYFTFASFSSLTWTPSNV